MWQDLIFKLYSNKITVDENLIEQKIKNHQNRIHKLKNLKFLK